MNYKAVTKELTLKTNRRLEFITITKEVENFIKESGVIDGSVVV